MEIKRIETKLEIDDSVDFCAYVISSWHLTVLYAALLKLQNEIKHDIKGYILISSFNANGTEKYRIDASMLKEFEGIEIIYFYNKGGHLSKKEYARALHGLCKNTSKRQKKIYLFSSFDYNFTWGSNFNFLNKRNIILCRTDEGSGTYIPKRDFYYFGYPETEKFLKKKIKALIRTALRTLSIIYVKFAGISLSSFFLLKKNRGCFITNEENAKFIRKIVIDAVSLASGAYKKEQVLILKDYDWNMISESDSIQFYQRIIDLLNKTSNKEIYIKRHPCDTNINFANFIQTSYKNVHVIDSVNGIENLYMQLSPCLVFGGDSTATYTIRILFETKVINFTQLYLSYKVKNEVRLKNIIKRNRYFKNAKDNILIDSLEDKRLLEIVNGL